MRLTLRTMLAYLDDVLEPSDAEQLGKKIQESEFASGLVHRIRGSIRKLRLGAPKLEGKGMALDPNTVAEYLDGSLAADRVPDFEKVCLESDVHLAEVASCHQILTLVLGEPADISTAARDRVYAIGALTGTEQASELGAAAAEAPTKPEEPSPVASDVGPTATKSSRPAATPPEIPDYLKAGTRRRIMPYLATGLLVFLIASVLFVAIGSDSIVALFRGDQSAAAPAAEAAGQSPTTEPLDAATADSEPETQVEAQDEAATETGSSTGQSLADTAVTDQASAGEPATVQPGGASGDAPVEPPRSAAAGPGSSTTTVTPRAASPDTPASDTPASDTAASDTATSDTAAGDSEPPAAGLENPLRSPLGAAPPLPGPPAPPTAGDADAEEAATSIGRFTSENQVVARLDPGSGEWFRLPANSPLAPGDELLALPNYRPQLMIEGVQVTFAGPSKVQLGPLDEQGFPQISVEYGRLMILPISREGIRVHMQTPTRSGVAIFNDASATMAVEVRRHMPPGSDPILDALPSLVQIFSTSGLITWQGARGEATIGEGEMVRMIDDGPVQVFKSLSPPKWDAPKDIDRMGAQTLEQLIDTERPLLVSLEERVADDRVEVRSLASRCLSYLDRHESFVNMLLNPEDKSFWEDSFLTAQLALARSVDSATAVRAAFQKLRGEDAAELYRMLWGYTNAQLRNGAAEQLVEYLGHESLDFRVLAITNLEMITGKTFLYSPEASERRRLQPMQRWRELAEKGEIGFRSSPTRPSSRGRDSSDARGPDARAPDARSGAASTRPDDVPALDRPLPSLRPPSTPPPF